MSDNRKYYYMRLKESYFESSEQLYLESLPDGYAYSNILLKLYLRSLNRDGLLMLNDRTPYNVEMLARMTRHPVRIVKKALALFQELGIIEVQPSGAIFMLDVQSFVGKTSTESDRIRDYRARVKRSKTQTAEAAADTADGVTACVTNVQDTPCECTPETEQKTDTEKEIKTTTETLTKRERERAQETDARAGTDATAHTDASPPQGSSVQLLISRWNSLGLDQTSELMPDATRRALCHLMCRFGAEAVLQAVETVRQSKFLRYGGKNGWRASFDWFVQEENFLKIRNGVYDPFQ